jgi:hypothetical protein
MSHETRKRPPVSARILVGIIRVLATAVTVLFATITAAGGDPKANAPLLPPDVPSPPRNGWRP